MSGAPLSRSEVSQVVDEAVGSVRQLITQLQGARPVFVGADGPAFAAGWASYGGFLGANYWMVGRTLHMAGLVTKTGGVPAVGDQIFVLPADRRPAGDEIFVVATGEPLGVGRVDVSATSGAVTWQGGSTGGADYTSLSGIRFWVP